MTTQQTIRYAELGQPTIDRWQKLLKSARRDLSERMRALLTIGLDACQSHGPAAMQARWHGGCLWICCQQSELATILGCTDRTVRSELQRLMELCCLQTIAHPTLPNVIGYRFNLAVLESLPESHTPELDEIIVAFAELQEVEAEVSAEQKAAETPVSATISAGFSAPFSAPISGGISAGISGQISAPVSALMNHEGLNEFYNNSSITHDQAHETREEPEKTTAARFDQILDRDIRGISGFQVEVNGRTGTPSERNRLAKLREYFAYAVQAGLADESEFRLFGALFRNVGRRTDVKHRARYLRTVWTNRHEKPIEAVVTSADREYLRRLLECEQLVPS